MKDKIQLGEYAPDGAMRDAIHIAIAPVIAGANLNPGDHVGFDEDGRVSQTNRHQYIGVIDPFLTGTIRQGTQVYLLLYPGTIHSLRHHWTHPWFKETDLVEAENPRIAEAKSWITQYAEGLGLTYEELMQGASDYIKYDNFLYKGGLLEGHNTAEEFWVKYEIITGISGDRGNFFSCSC